MRSAKKTYEIDMLHGAILPKLLRFAVPLTLSTMLQLLFNAADLVVVGRYCGSVSVAAVGSTGAITNLIINLFIGMSVGAGVALRTTFRIPARVRITSGVLVSPAARIIEAQKL